MISRNEVIKIVTNLVVIYLVGGFILVSAYAFTKPIIDKNNDMQENHSSQKNDSRWLTK